MKRFAHIIITLMVLCVASGSGQTFSQAELQKILNKAVEKTSEYSIVFRNLTAEETKTSESFDKTGKLKNRKTIVSDLIIYEPEKNPNGIAEFHSVREVDGKKIKNGDQRTINFFSQIKNAKSLKDELEKLNEESSRYDEDLSVYGITMVQPLPLASNLIASFKFEEADRENIEGISTVAVKFQQTVVNPDLNIKINSMDGVEISDSFYRGTVWLDLRNARILKLIIELTLVSEKFTEPFVAIRQEFNYQPGQFEIYLPRKIIVENFKPQIGKSVKLLLKNIRVKIDSKLETRLTMEYKNFSKFDVIVKSDN